MNRYREDTPYVYRPPKYSRFWAPVIYAVNDAVYLRRVHRMSAVNVQAGGEVARDLYAQGHSLLFTPNHSSHCDPHVLLHLSRRYRIPIHFMAAREVFEMDHGLRGVAMQRAGVFSVDREGSDIRAIKEALRIMCEGTYPLVLFPEGEVYHLNEKLTPLNEGAATIAFRAARKIVKQGGGRGVFIVPTAIRYRYVEDISSSFPTALDRLEHHLLWRPQRHLDVTGRVYKFGEALLSLKEREYLDRTLEGPLPERLDQFRELLIASVEERRFGQVRAGTHPERVRRARGKIRTVILAPERPAPDVLDECYRDLDRLYLAVQLYSYPGQYLRERPSVDRIAETVIKFEEDVFGKTGIEGRRRANVTFCEPVDVCARLEDYAVDAAGVTREVTAQVEQTIRAVLEDDGQGDGAAGPGSVEVSMKAL